MQKKQIKLIAEHNSMHINQIMHVYDMQFRVTNVSRTFDRINKNGSATPLDVVYLTESKVSL